MKHPRLAAVVAGIATFALLLPATPATASPDTDGAADRVANAISKVAPTKVVPTDLERRSSGLSATLADGGRADLAMKPRAGIKVFSAEGAEVVSFTLPDAGRLADAAVADDGSVTYLGDAKTPSVNVSPAEHALRVTTVIESAAQTQRFSYDFGPGAVVELQEDGGAIAYVIETVTDPETGETADAEKIVANIAAPWAKDAKGVDVPTRYLASGSVLTQVVSHVKGKHEYPVVADPTFDRPNIFQYRVRFNRAETATIASAGSGVIASIGCFSMLPVCVLAGGVIWWNASVAQNSSPKRCVQITATQPYVWPGLVWWVDTYTGGPCR